MKSLKLCVLPFTVALLLTACGNNKPNENFTLINPEDTSMLTANCKAYIDAMREQEQSLTDKYQYDDLNAEGPVDIDEGSKKDSERIYLDTGDVNGKNQTVSGAVPDRSDKNMGVELKFEAKEGIDVSDCKIVVSEYSGFENAKEYKAENNSVTVKNLFVNTQYYWKVVAGDLESKPATFTTGDYPRWISARPLYNVRDLGGYMTDSGKRVKQGLIFRGGEITNQSWNEHLKTNSPESKKVFIEDMGMMDGLEIDLRKQSGNEREPSNVYTSCGFAGEDEVYGNVVIGYENIEIGSYHNTINNNRNEIKEIFEKFAEADQHHVYFHCYGGADRTGTIAFLLNGLLGVSYTDLVIDFELTSYSSINNEHIRSHLRDHQYDHWRQLIDALKSNTTNNYSWNEEETVKENVEEFLTLACGISDTTINKIRNIMLED